MEHAIPNREKELNDLTEMFKTHFGKLKPSELNQKPNAQSWSIAEILEHLIKTNESYYPAIEKARNGQNSLPWIARFDFITNFFGNFILKSVEPERKTKVKTFPVWQPVSGNAHDNILFRFEKHQKEFIDFMNSCNDLIQKQTVISSPANKMIVYKLDKAFDIIVEHEKRHYNQALEVLALLNNKAA